MAEPHKKWSYICVACGEEPQEKHHWDWNLRLCSSCKQKRFEAYGRILKDQSYHAHLARRALGVNCDASSGCPEEPAGHADFDRASYNQLSQSEKDRHPQFHEIVISLASRCMYRESADSITAFEIIVTQLESAHPVKYCKDCLASATRDFPEQNIQVELCPDCLFKRDDHVNSVHEGQTPFHEPWERNVQTRPVKDFEYLGEDFPFEGGFDDNISLIRYDLEGGGAAWTTEEAAVAGIVTVSVAGVVAWIAWLTYRINARKLRNDTITNIENVELGRARLILDRDNHLLERAKFEMDIKKARNESMSRYRVAPLLEEGRQYIPNQSPAYVNLREQHSQTVPSRPRSWFGLPSRRSVQAADSNAMPPPPTAPPPPAMNSTIRSQVRRGVAPDSRTRTAPSAPTRQSAVNRTNRSRSPRNRVTT